MCQERVSKGPYVTDKESQVSNRSIWEVKQVPPEAQWYHTRSEKNPTKSHGGLTKWNRARCYRSETESPNTNHILRSDSHPVLLVAGNYSTLNSEDGEGSPMVRKPLADVIGRCKCRSKKCQGSRAAKKLVVGDLWRSGECRQKSARFVGSGAPPASANWSKSSLVDGVLRKGERMVQLRRRERSTTAIPGTCTIKREMIRYCFWRR